MGNDFVEYLKSMNNASSNTINALAESQVTNKYYNEIRVERKLGKYIAESIQKGEHKVFILTGHAGDGKTSILVQVLKDLGMINDGESLQVAAEVEANENILFYVKDMSELDKDTQEKYLHQALQAPMENKSSILISNTGPLINTFKEIKDISMDGRELESTLLEHLDVNNEEDVSIEHYNFKLINIARIDNVNFVRSILNKIIKDGLWTSCMECDNRDICPICCNYKCIKENEERVMSFLESYYRWLYENDKRMTIRQIASQISYAMTGNLSCKEIKLWQSATYAKFTYNFANLFFGYRGIVEIEYANQIRGIEQLKSLKLDSIALDEDYELFVKNNFDCLPENIRIIVKAAWSNFSKRYHSIDIDTETDSKVSDKKMLEDIRMRKAIRRFYLMYSSYENIGQVERVFEQIYGEIFPLYKKALLKKLSPVEKKPLRNLVFDALYINNIGMPPKKRDNLYLTLKREDGAFQNVFLQLGEAKISALEIVQDKVNSVFDDIEEKYELFLELNRDKKFRFPLNLQIVTYFKLISSGAITTNVNPALTHGIAQLNELLLRKFKFDNEEEQMKLIINTVNEPIVIECNFNEDQLYIE